MENSTFNVDKHTPEEALQFLQAMALSSQAQGTLNDAVVLHNAITIAAQSVKDALPTK